MNTEPRMARHHPRILLTLEAYAKARPAFRAAGARAQEGAHRPSGRARDAAVRGRAHVRYQIQEMLRIEKTFEEAGIRDELDAYNPLVPDGTNLKATMLIEYEDVDERRAALARLRRHRAIASGSSVDGIRAGVSRSPTRICRARTTRRRRRCTSCASSSTRRRCAALKRGAALGDRRRSPGLRASRYRRCRRRRAPRSRPTSR